MKLWGYKVIGVLFGVMLCLALVPKNTVLAKNIASGDGWYLDDSGTLYLTGEIDNPATEVIVDTPWGGQDASGKWIGSQIKAIVAEEGSSAANGIYLFGGLPQLETVDLAKFDFSKMTNMENMFSNDEKLKEIDMNGWDTSNVTSMECMFLACTEMTSVHIKDIDASKVENMDSMFSKCESMTELIIENMDTSSVKSMYNIFNACKSLTTLDLRSFDTSNLTSLSRMFNECSSLTSVDLSSFDTSNVKYMSYTFYGCKNLKKLDLSHFDTSKVLTFSCMLKGCASLASLDISSFDTSKAVDLSEMFYQCSSLSDIDVSRFNTSNAENMTFMFYGCEGITSMDLSHFDTAKVTVMYLMFDGCKNLVTLDVSSFDCSKIQYIGSIIANCDSLRDLRASESFIKTVADQLIAFSTKWINKEDGTHYGDEEALGKITGIVTLYNHKFHDFSEYFSIGHSKHIIKCVYCNEVQEGHEGDACSGGVATCLAKAKCSLCKAEYGSLKAHTFGTKWIINDNNHWHACTACGKTKDGAAHSMQTITTDKATLTADGKKITKCSVCSKVTKTTTINAVKSITLSNTSYVYDGKAKKPAVTVKDSKGNTISNNSYTVTYGKGRKTVGQYSVKITFKGDYSGSKVLTFVVNPKATAIKSIKPAKQGFNIKWAKQTKQVDGYEIQYATNSKFTAGLKKVTIGKKDTVSKKISKLKAKKTYYVRVRTYKKVNGKKYYSAWTKTEMVKTK